MVDPEKIVIEEALTNEQADRQENCDHEWAALDATHYECIHCLAWAHDKWWL